MVTYPNQDIIIIKKTPCKNNFLQISNEEWMTAAKACGTSLNAFKIYLYLAANEVNYEKVLSKEDIAKKLGIKSSSYYDNIKKLKELGYIKEIGGNRLEFYTTPFHSSGNEKNNVNSAQVENKEKVLNSAQVEENALVHSSEILEKNQDSPRVENKYYDLCFNF